jgi:hypothetical protein
MASNRILGLHRAWRRQVCTGACPFFASEYVAGRRVPGVGTCERHASEVAVTVGIECLWTAKATSPVPAQLSQAAPATRPERIAS